MEHLHKLVEHFRNKSGDLPTEEQIKIPKATDALFIHIEETLLPHLMRVFQKDNSLFVGENCVELFPGIKVNNLWTGSDTDWSRVNMALLYSLMHGDPKAKFGKILETFKGMLPGGAGGTADEINKILDDEDTQDSLKEILDLVINTRLASLIGEIVQSISLADLDLDFENQEQLLEMLKNPTAHPALKEVMDRAQQLLQEKVRTGKINQQELVREIEMIRAKCVSSFGKYLNEMVVGEPGNTTGNTASQIMSNSPEARRARMLARLQKKQRDKNRK
jgi:hypothetical protein